MGSSSISLSTSRGSADLPLWLPILPASPRALLSQFFARCATSLMTFLISDARLLMSAGLVTILGVAFLAELDGYLATGFVAFWTLAFGAALELEDVAGAVRPKVASLF